MTPGTPTPGPRLAAPRLSGALVLAALAGAALGAFGVDIRVVPTRESDRDVVLVCLLGWHAIVVPVSPADAHLWARWTAGVRAVAGAVAGLLAVVALGLRATAGLRFATFRLLEAVRGCVLGGLVGVLVAGLGFALLGAVVEAMLGEPSWQVGRGPVMGAGLGGLLGGLGGAAFGAATTIAGAQKRYEVLRAQQS
jgi:hypothetical protein